MAQAGGPLSHLTVLDLTHHIAGPYCTGLLAGLGAEVIKVERPGAGDPSRSVGPFPGDVPHLEKSGLFLYLNQSKKSVTLNLQAQAGVEILRRLLLEADILVENFHPRVMPSLGLDYQALERLNRRLVMTSISNFGQTGPYRDWKATDMTLAAMSGLMHESGEPGQEPLRLSANIVQFEAGVYAFAATMTGLFHRETSGEGLHVDVSVFQALAASLENAFSALFFTGRIPTRVGSYNFGLGMLLPSEDAYVGIAGVGFRDQQWQAFCELVGSPELINDPRFATREARMASRDLMLTTIMGAVAGKKRDELFHEGQRLHLPIGAVYSIDEAFADPHLQARGFWQDVEHPVAGTYRYPGPPFRMSTYDWPFGPAPTLGQHNEEIYCGQLGYTQDELVRLRQSNII